MEAALGMARAKKLIPRARTRLGHDRHRWFRALLRLLPVDFRSDYGEELEHTFATSSATRRARLGRDPGVGRRT